MLSDIENVRKMMALLGDEGFVDALEGAERLVEDADETLERVERIEGEAEAAVQEANQALRAVDTRLQKFDETVSLLEAKIEAAFSVGFFFFALNSYLEGSLLIAAGLFVMGLLGISSLVVTIVNLPQVQRLRQVGEYATDQLDDAIDQFDDERQRPRRPQRQPQRELERQEQSDVGRREPERTRTRDH